jgi:hypothetical protein
MRLIETDTFANAIDKYLVDIESSADKSQNLTLETDT